MENSNLLFGMDNSYSENSLAQDACHHFILKDLECFARNYNFDKSISIGIFGCGPGDNDIILLKDHLIPIFKKRNKDLIINLFMIDIAETKWSIQKNMTLKDNIFIKGIKNDIYQKIFSNNSLDLVISFSCLHWINNLPFKYNSIKDVYTWSNLDFNMKNQLREYLDIKFLDFLDYRYQELKDNGKIILSFDADVENFNHQYQGPSDCLALAFKNIRDKDNNLWSDVLNKFFIPTGPRKLNRVLDIINKTKFINDNTFNQYIKCPSWEKRIKNLDNKDVNKIYFKEVIDAIMSCMLPIIENIIETKEKVNIFKDILYKEIKNILEENVDEKYSTAGQVLFVNLTK